MAHVVALSDYWWGWGNLLFRWLHVIAAMAWIGASFYFIALDNHLEPPRDPADAKRGVSGEAWEIHGGGFYRVEKFQLAPERLPEPLHWFKWEAYTTWLSGFALFIVVYYSHATSYLIDPSVRDLTAWEAITLSVVGIVIAWLVYDLLCRAFADDEGVLAVLVFGFVCLSAWGSWELFAPRAAYLQVGAMIGTMMVGNVFFVIIPNHWKLVRAKEAGRDPDPRWNRDGKTRSVHNNYLTLPVLFAMLSNHFPFTYGHRNGWLVLVALMAVGALIRHYFNLRHRGLNVWPILLLAGAWAPRRGVDHPVVTASERPVSGSKKCSRLSVDGELDRFAGRDALAVVDPGREIEARSLGSTPPLRLPAASRTSLTSTGGASTVKITCVLGAEVFDDLATSTPIWAKTGRRTRRPRRPRAGCRRSVGPAPRPGSPCRQP